MSDKYKNSDMSMNAEEKLNILIAEYHSLKTEVEKKVLMKKCNILYQRCLLKKEAEII